MITEKTMPDSSQSTSERQAYENSFVPDSFADYFTDNRFIKGFKFIALLLVFIFFFSVRLLIKKMAILDLTTSDLLMLSMVGLGAWLINEGAILVKNIRAMESFVSRDLKVRNKSIASLTTWQQINKNYRFIDGLLIGIFVFALFSPHLFPYRGINAISTYIFVIELFIYAILRLRMLCPYLNEFRSFLFGVYNLDSGPSSPIACFNFKNIGIKAAVVGVAFFGGCLLVGIDTPFMLFAYASSAGLLYFIGNGVYHYRAVFRTVAGEIDNVRMESSI